MNEMIMSISDIIQRCADLRGVGCLPDRSVGDFEHFVMSVLYADELKGYDASLQDDYYLDRYTPVRDELARAFLVHCQDIYDPRKVKLQRLKQYRESLEDNLRMIAKLEGELNGNY